MGIIELGLQGTRSGSCNIVEYKSPEDHMNIDTFYKAGAYGCLYKAYGESINEHPADDITISIIRDTRPEGLFGILRSIISG